MVTAMAGSHSRTETLVGLFLLIGLAMLGGLVFTFGNFDDRFAGRYTITVVFEDASGLIKGSEVRMGGARIGKVGDTPRLTDQVKVEVPLDIIDDIRIPQGAEFRIASASILGDKLIVITPPAKPAKGTIAPGSVVTGSGTAGLDAIQDNAVALSAEAKRLLAGADTTLKHIDGAVADIREATTALKETLGKLNDGVLSAENLDHLAATLKNLDRVSAGLEPVLADAREAIGGVKSAADGARETFDKASARIDELEPALKDVPGAVASLSRAADQAAETLERVEDGKGLLGTLAYDEGVSDDARTFIRNLRRDGILRYRDEEHEGPEDDPRARFRSRRR